MQRERARAAVRARARGERRRQPQAGEGNAVERVCSHFMFQRAYPGTDLEDAADLDAPTGNSIAHEQRATLERAPSLVASASRWQLLGPGNFAGRVNSIAVDRNNRNRIFIATSSGGVWRSLDAGATWTDVSATLGTNINGILAVDPGNSNVVYCATGDNQYQFRGRSDCSSPRTWAATWEPDRAHELRLRARRHRPSDDDQHSLRRDQQRPVSLDGRRRRPGRSS